MSTRVLAIIAVLGAVLVAVLVIQGWRGDVTTPPAAVVPPPR